MSDISREGNKGVAASGDIYVPASSFVSTETTELENDRLWFRTWLCAGRVEEISSKGDYVSFSLLDEQVIVVRTGDGEEDIEAYYNVCAHRGRQLLDQPRGNVSSGFYCRFHGWQYGLDGKLKQATDPEDFCESALEGVRLKTVKIAQWAGWVWINFDPGAPPLDDYLGPIKDIVAPLELENLRRFWHVTIHAPVNWKVVVMAFNEGYHSGATHINGVSYKPLKSPTVLYGDHSKFDSEWSNFTSVREPSGGWRQVTDLRENLQVGVAHLHEKLQAISLDPMRAAADRVQAELPETATVEEVMGAFWQYQIEETEKTGAKWPSNLKPEHLMEIGTDWHLFPSTIFLPSPDGTLWYRVLPSQDGRSCYFDVWSLGRYAPGKEPEVEDQFFPDFDSFRGNNPFLEEDFDNMVAVDRGMRSRGFSGAILNPLQEIQQRNFAEVLQRYLAGGPATGEARA